MEFLCFMTILVRLQIFDTWQLCHNIFCGSQMSWSQNIVFSWWNVDEVHHPQSWRVTLGRFGVFPHQAIPTVHMWTGLFCYENLKSIRPHLKSRKDIWAGPSSRGQLVQPPPNTSISKLTKISTCLEHEVFICYIGSHDSGHCPTPTEAFHSRRLPPHRSQTPS